MSQKPFEYLQIFEIEKGRGVSSRFLITFNSSSQSVDRNLKKTECEESECALEMENNEIVIHDA